MDMNDISAADGSFPDQPRRRVTFEEARDEAIAVWHAERAFVADADTLMAGRAADFHPTGGRA